MTKRDRTTAARAAFRAHHEAKNTPRNHISGGALFVLARNPDLYDDLTDLVTDVLHLARQLGDDPARILRCAATHIGAETGKPAEPFAPVFSVEIDLEALERTGKTTAAALRSVVDELEGNDGDIFGAGPVQLRGETVGICGFASIPSLKGL
jgi:hypothetical protein